MRYFLKRLAQLQTHNVRCRRKLQKLLWKRPEWWINAFRYLQLCRPVISSVSFLRIFQFHILTTTKKTHFSSNLFLNRKKRQAVGSMDRSHHVWLRKLELTKNVLRTVCELCWMADWYRPIHFTFFFLISIINQIPPRIRRVYYSVHFSEKYCPWCMVDVDVRKYGIDK